MFKEENFFENCVIMINENIKDGYMVREHWHRYVEILYILTGEAVQVIDGDSITMSAGDTILIPQDMVHSTYATTMECKILVVLCDLDFLDNKSFPDYIFCPSENLYSNEMKELFSRVLDEFTYKNDGFIDIIKGSLLSITAYLNRLIKPLVRITNDSKNIKDIFIYIEDNLGKRLTVAGVARHFGYTPQHLTKLITSYAGVSFKPYLDKARIVVAIRMLLFEGLTVGEIAQRLGYEDTTTFYRAFKRVTGLSPREYKRKHQILQNA